MSAFEYRLASLVLRLLGWVFDRLPARPDRVVLATARLGVLEGNLLALHDAIRRLRPATDVVLLLEPYGYGLGAKLRYLARTIRGTYHVRTAGLVVVDNAYLPVHVAPHRRRTTVVQVWHAAGALKRFGVDTVVPPAEPERTFLHRHYDYVVASGEASREPWARALRTPVERVLALGTPRTDVLFDATAMAAARARRPGRAPRPGGAARGALGAHVPRSRARPHRGAGPRRRAAAGPAAAPTSSSSRSRRTRTWTRPSSPPPASTWSARPDENLNDWLAAADVLLTDYSSSIFEWALLRRPLVLLVDDLEAYERDPGLYLDYGTEMIGTPGARHRRRGGRDPATAPWTRPPGTRSSPATWGRATAGPPSASWSASCPRGTARATGSAGAHCVHGHQDHPGRRHRHRRRGRDHDRGPLPRHRPRRGHRRQRQHRARFDRGEHAPRRRVDRDAGDPGLPRHVPAARPAAAGAAQPGHADPRRQAGPAARRRSAPGSSTPSTG